MSCWEYKVVPAPTKGLKAKGVKGPEERFSHALQVLMNEMGADGWEFQRTETLPSIERSGLTGSTTEWRNVMVFRRMAKAPIDAFEPELLPAPDATSEPVKLAPEATSEPEPTPPAPDAKPERVPIVLAPETRAEPEPMSLAPVSDSGEITTERGAAVVAEDSATDTEGEAKATADENVKDATFIPGPGATRMLPDNGVEETSDVAGMTASLRRLVEQRKDKNSTH